VRVCVYGLWHLGSVTAACVAGAGHHVRGLDPDKVTVERLGLGKPPVSEPGLADLLTAGLDSGHLSFYSDARAAVDGCDVLWLTFDTPVDADDHADVAYVLKRLKELLPALPRHCLILISSQLPVGTCRELEHYSRETISRPDLSFACSPENLRLGKAIEVFRNPDRIVVGTRALQDRETVQRLLSPVADRIEWMSVESAEMTKHAVNGFLALSVTYANELAAICEEVGADAKEVERGLKTERRIGPAAYLSPGPAFAGGTLARDVAFLNEIAGQNHVQVPLLAAIQPSNAYQKGWPERKLREALGSLMKKRIAVWGLTYKPGTDTLRRSTSVELCMSLITEGAHVHVHDPAIRSLPSELTGIQLEKGPETACRGAHALVIMTPWPEFRSIDMKAVINNMAVPNILDPGRLLPATAVIRGIRYFAVGSPQSSTNG
jgi:UDPglucose 6-dehydrogenase